MKNLSLMSLILIALISPVFGQSFSVKGIVVDSLDGSSLPGASISLIPARADQQQLNMLSGSNGEFEFKLANPGRYLIRISFMGYFDFADSVRVRRNESTTDLGKLKLKRTSIEMKEVDITGVAIPSSQSEDTLSFAAKGYKTNPDATAEDLVTKLPGVQKEEGTLKAQGEEVKQVLIDGQPFFGDDPNVTLKNLPADLIEKVEIFDKLSDQARFTGFDDGQTSKTINIVTKRDRRNGQFGKLYGGYGSTEKFQSGGTVNFFTEGRRISLLGLANNVNQQNFSQQDLLGLNQGGGSGGHREGFQGRGGGHGGGNRGGGNAANNFLIGALEGNTKTWSTGVNYQENWGRTAVLTGSYFFNFSDNSNNQTIGRQYFTSTPGNQLYDEISSSNSKNYNHRLNFRLEYNLDTMNTIVLTPRFSFQTNESASLYYGISTFGNQGRSNSTDSKSGSDGSGYTFNNELIYRLRFATPGRSLSFTINTGINRRTLDRNQFSDNRFTTGNNIVTFDTINQKGNDLVKGYNYSGNVVYTEPAGKNGQLQASISAGMTNNFSDKNTFNYNNALNRYDLLDSISTNKYDNDYMTYRGGIAYRLRDEAISLNVGLNYQIAQLTGDQSFPNNIKTEKDFYNFLPSLRFNYKISEAQNFRVFYNTNVNAPSITQLQNFYDVSNPLFIKAGNPDLKAEFSHRMSAQYLTTDKTSGANFFTMAFWQITKDYVGSSSFTAQKDTLIGRNVLVKRGSQFSFSRNFEQSNIGRFMLSGGLPVPFIKSNISLNVGIGYQTLPSEYQSLTTESKLYSFNQGITIASNISEDIDFKFTWSPSYYIARNELLPNTNDEYWVHSGTANLFFNVFDLFFIRTDYSLYKTSGISNGGDITYSLWNAGIGVKFLEGDRAELRLDVFDLLNENKSFIRTATDIYIENKTTQVLKQYFMLTFTYNLRAF
ncbi:MAG: TonB-dependent receptor [Ignavibacteria bacterium]|nr:TonB-dependent receptor [Ignavibacteria bacterium]